LLSIFREQAVGGSLYDRDELALEPALVNYLLLARAVFRVKESSWAVFPSIWVAPRECILLSSLIFLRDGSFLFSFSRCSCTGRMKIKPPADVTDFEGSESSKLDSKSGRNYAEAQLI
jgi:hypothetical protein